MESTAPVRENQEAPKPEDFGLTEKRIQHFASRTHVFDSTLFIALAGSLTVGLYRALGLSGLVLGFLLFFALGLLLEWFLQVWERNQGDFPLYQQYVNQLARYEQRLAQQRLQKLLAEQTQRRAAQAEAYFKRRNAQVKSALWGEVDRKRKEFGEAVSGRDPPVEISGWAAIRA